MYECRTRYRILPRREKRTKGDAMLLPALAPRLLSCSILGSQPPRTSWSVMMPSSPCLHLAVISGLLHLTVPVTRCCFSCRQSIGYAIKRPHHLRTMSRAISRTHQVFFSCLGPCK
ncbi:hypothetical protein V8C34DRAFT_279647 [Trichoderma compactum]